MVSRLRLWSVVAVLGVVAAGCGGGHANGRAGAGSANGRPGIADHPSGSQLALLRRYYPGWDTDFTRHAMALSQFQDGGPPRDGRRPVVTATVAGRPLVVLYTRGVVSTLGQSRIARSRDVGTAGAFDPRLGKRTLRFTAGRGGTFRDQAGTTWDVTGRAIAGPLRGSRLRALRHDEQFWFALAAFVPHARLLGVGSGR